MFIIVIGTRASGKSTIKDYLLQHKEFKHVRLVYGGKAGVDETFTSAEKSQEKERRRYSEQNSTSSDDANSSDDINDARPDQLALTTDRLADSKLDTRASLLSITSSTPSTLVDSLEDSETVAEIDGIMGFTDPARLLDHVTRHWRDNFVTEDITTREVLEPFLKRPFVLLVSVDAPTLVRFHRHQKYKQSPSKFSFFNNRKLLPSRRHTITTLDQFIADDDRVSFGPDSDHVTSAYLFASYHLCHVNVINSFPSAHQLYAHLDALDILNPDRLRPGWDSYFMVDFLIENEK
ncbi:hypothetical protein EW145_g900 [Phellinidium pouzarii]|uniref:Uncharacterized protein n=1 Tax=Phellinidium pouzarii TaxID=167371 RepID=A0A4S4LGR6_9AGAM|nr:hypothetical protein EW145_g900 [Phellinidium pouzarii]